MNSDKCDVCGKPMDLTKDSMVQNEKTGALCCADCFVLSAMEILEAVDDRNASRN